MTGEDTAALPILVNAVCKAYLTGIVQKETRARQTRLDQLQKYYAEYDANLRDKRATVRPGQTARYIFTLKAMGSLKGAIKLTAAGRVANRVAFSRNPAPASGTVVATVATSTKAGPESPCRSVQVARSGEVRM